MWAPSVGGAIGGASGAFAASFVSDLMHKNKGNKDTGTGSGSTYQVTNHFYVDGSGNPAVTAKAIADQIDAANKLAAERGQTTP